MREIKDKLIDACMSVNIELSSDVYSKIEEVYALEHNKHSKKALKLILENCKVAKKERLPLCQDTGMMEIFVFIGQHVFIDFSKIKQKTLNDFLNSCVLSSYKKGFFRKSVVSPLARINKGDNIPAVIHTEFTQGNELEIYLMPKGFGCENMSALKMFNPTAKHSEIIDFVVNKVKDAGPNPCPPIFLGIGIGGTSELAMLLAKKAGLGIKNKDIAKEEKDMIEDIKEKIIKKANALNIGTFGLGGRKTLLDVNINTYPTHIAGLPVGLTFSCWCNRSKKVVF